jgi:hypothetical protein
VGRLQSGAEGQSARGSVSIQAMGESAVTIPQSTQALLSAPVDMQA